MENQTITGVGCFAGPERLSRIFMRMIHTYTLGKLNRIDWINAWESEGKEEGTHLLKALIAGESAWRDSAVPDFVAGLEIKKITGFFLILKDQSLELSIFAKNGDCRRERHSAVLDGITKVRRNRLN